MLEVCCIGEIFSPFRHRLVEFFGLQMETGGVDTNPQFKSVKDAVSLFSGSAFTGNQSIMKRSRPYIPERVMTREWEQHLVHEELYKLRRQLKTADLSNMKTYNEMEEERKLVEDTDRKLSTFRTSVELPCTGKVASDITGGTETENTLTNVLESLKLELVSLKGEHSKLMVEESKSGSVRCSLKTQKLELDACLAEEYARRGQFGGLISALQEMLLETRDARKEEEREMKLMVEELKKEAEVASSSLEQIENELRLALEETEKAKSSEARILDQIRSMSENTTPSTTSTPESITEITIPEAEFENLIQRVHEEDTITEMKVAAAREQIEAAKASEHKALKKLKRRQKQIEDMLAILDLVSKRAQVAEAAKKELRKQLRREQKNSPSRTSSTTETPPYHRTKTSKHNLAVPRTKNKGLATGGCLP